ncbi:MAG: LD-carboxypeptidase [Candidatus Omnitrophota bacterium]
MMRVFKRPSALKRGDTIGIVAPAWSFDPRNFKRGVDKLNNLGFKVKFDKSIFNKYWSMAGYDQQRAAQVNRMFADREVKAILCAKGGYGSIRILPYLDKKIIRRNPKIFVGYSDITILLSYLYRIANMAVFHGPVVSGEIHNNMNPITFKYLLRSITQPQKLGRLKFPGMKSLNRGRATGVLVGGNLSLIMGTIGTPYDINTDNKVLFLEDMGEDLETIDSYLMQLKLTGKFRKIKGIVFGKMVDCRDRSGKKYTIKDILRDMLRDIDVPIIFGFPSGHRFSGQINVTLPFGVSVTVDGDNAGLILNESGVS